MVATINNFGGYYRTEVYVHEARMLGAKIEAPSLNEGAYESIIVEKRIILGFVLVQGAESKIIHKIYEERAHNGLFTSFENLTKRVYIPLEQLLLIIRIGATRDFTEDRKSQLWKAHLYHNKVKDKDPTPELFPFKRRNFELPQLNDNDLEKAFEQLELIGFPLCNPFLLAGEPLPPHIPAKDISKNLSLRVTCVGYLVALKHSKTVRGDTMSLRQFH